MMEFSMSGESKDLTLDITLSCWPKQSGWLRSHTWITRSCNGWQI